MIRKRLLIIDDNPMMGGFLSHMFGKEYEVMWCSNAEEAMAWLRERNIPDLIICDYELTGITGCEFLTQTKNTSFYKDIPVIMLSGNSNSENRIKCLQAGAEDFVIKPFNPTELSLKVENALQKSAATLLKNTL